MSIKRTFKVAFITKGDVLIYLALSRDKRESITSLKKQLEVLHLQFVSLTTSLVLEHLR
jgi:DNA-binding MurR/RpiR family transcriptional regulator